MNILTGKAGIEYVVRNERTEIDTKTEKAVADRNGVLRDGNGKSYSAGVYSIITPIHEDDIDD